MTDNERLAVEVMGWESGEGTHWWCDKCADWIHCQQVSYMETHRIEGCGNPVRLWKDIDGDWQPDKDIAQAFMLVKKIRKRGWFVMMHSKAFRHSPYEWAVKLENHQMADDISFHSVLGGGNTPAAAICAAIIKTLEDK